MKWVETSSDCVRGDDFVERYRNADILLICPNGGILGVSVDVGFAAWSLPTDRKYHDHLWHVLEARKFIDSLMEGDRND